MKRIILWLCVGLILSTSLSTLIKLGSCSSPVLIDTTLDVNTTAPSRDSLNPQYLNVNTGYSFSTNNYMPFNLSYYFQTNFIAGKTYVFYWDNLMPTWSFVIKSNSSAIIAPILNYTASYDDHLPWLWVFTAPITDLYNFSVATGLSNPVWLNFCGFGFWELPQLPLNLYRESQDHNMTCNQFCIGWMGLNASTTYNLYPSTNMLPHYFLYTPNATALRIMGTDPSIEQSLTVNQTGTYILYNLQNSQMDHIATSHPTTSQNLVPNAGIAGFPTLYVIVMAGLTIFILMKKKSIRRRLN